MPTRTISITNEAYERLRSLKRNEKMSFSDVILEHFPRKRKLSEVLAEIGECSDLADSIEKASKEMRKSRLRKVEC
jgi:predicted CopG family antitoxin